jgi:hypothetical protein
MDYAKAKQVNMDVDLVGFRAHAAAVGLLQLIKELRVAGNLSDAAVNRIRDAVIDNFSVTRSSHEPEEHFRSRLQTRLDRLLQTDGAV